MIVVFGSINLDLIFALPAIPHPGETVLGPDTRIEPGGKGANQAVAAARDGAPVVMAGAVGRDALAAGALRLLRAAGVDLSRIAETDATTGCAAIAVDPAGNNAIAVGSGANRLARAAQVEDGLLSPATTLVLQMEVPAEETATLIRRARARGARIVLNLAPAATLPDDALRMLDLLLVNETEAAWLGRHLGCDASAGALRTALSGVAVVRTLGAGGVEAATGSGVVPHAGTSDHAGGHHGGRGLLRRGARRRAGPGCGHARRAAPRDGGGGAELHPRRQPGQPADRRGDRRVSLIPAAGRRGRSAAQHAAGDGVQLRHERRIAHIRRGDQRVVQRAVAAGGHSARGGRRCAAPPAAPARGPCRRCPAAP